MFGFKSKAEPHRSGDRMEHEGTFQPGSERDGGRRMFRGMQHHPDFRDTPGIRDTPGLEEAEWAAIDTSAKPQVNRDVDPPPDHQLSIARQMLPSLLPGDGPPYGRITDTPGTHPSGGSLMKLSHPERLQRLRVARGASHRDLAKAAGYRAHGMIGELLSGARHNVSDRAAHGMAQYLGVSVEYLFDPVERRCT